MLLTFTINTGRQNKRTREIDLRHISDQQYSGYTKDKVDFSQRNILSGEENYSSI